MSHRRTHLWISLLVGLAVWGAYFGHFILQMRRGETVATGLIAWLFRRRSRVLDEGPTLDAALRASHVALMLLIGLALAAAAALALAALFGWSLDLSAARGQVIAANALLAMVVTAELLRAGLTLALLPRR